VKPSALLLGMWLLGGVVLTRESWAAEPPDDGLLEFLGSVDSEDKDWHDYLARTDIDKVAARAKTPPRPQPVAPNPPDPPTNKSDPPVAPP
jgi:hypothetical protein